MGLSASSYSILRLVNRRATIHRKESSLSLQRQALAKETRLLALERQEGVSAKVLKWSNDGGFTYKDITYAGLMNPSLLNRDDLHLITDYDGKTVVDGKFKKYAERISPDGRPGAEWSGETRLEILSELTGVSKDKIANQDEALKNCYVQEENLAAVNSKKPDPSKYGRKTSQTELFKTAGINSSNTKYSVASLKAAMLKLKTHLGSTENQEAFEKALTQALTPYETLTDGNSGAFGKRVSPSYQSKDPIFEVDMNKWMGELIGAYKANGGEVEKASGKEYQNGSGEYNLVWYTDYSNYKKAYDAWEKEYNSAKDVYNDAVKSKTTEFTAEQESLIDFYDTMFKAIAETGWTLNTDINDADYLNQMLQNNSYTLTRVDRTTVYDPKNKVILDENDYTTSIASNMSKIVSVTDKDAENQAMAEYEYKKSIISEKEARIDTQMKNLETEDAAIKQMIESIETVKNDNIKRTFNLFA